MMMLKVSKLRKGVSMLNYDCLIVEWKCTLVTVHIYRFCIIIDILCINYEFFFPIVTNTLKQSIEIYLLHDITQNVI
jgi:hypothetical protein